MFNVSVIEAITAVAALVTALTGFVAVWKIGRLHIEINSRMTELLQRTREAAMAEGYRNGVRDHAESIKPK